MLTYLDIIENQSAIKASTAMILGASTSKKQLI